MKRLFYLFAIVFLWGGCAEIVNKDSGMREVKTYGIQRAEVIDLLEKKE